MWWNYAVFMACGSIFEHPEVYALIPKQGNSKHIMIHPWSIQPFSKSDATRTNVKRVEIPLHCNKEEVCAALCSSLVFVWTVKKCDVFGRTTEWIKEDRSIVCYNTEWRNIGKMSFAFLMGELWTPWWTEGEPLETDQPAASPWTTQAFIVTWLSPASERGRERKMKDGDAAGCVCVSSSPYADAHLWLIWRGPLFLSVVLGRLTGYCCIGLCEKKWGSTV